ncbi:hypothetical protein [Pseudomonas sp. NPDC096950]
MQLVASGQPYRVGLFHCLDCRKHYGALLPAFPLAKHYVSDREGTGRFEK